MENEAILYLCMYGAILLYIAYELFDFTDWEAEKKKWRKTRLSSLQSEGRIIDIEDLRCDPGHNLVSTTIFGGEREIWVIDNSDIDRTREAGIVFDHGLLIVPELTTAQVHELISKCRETVSFYTSIDHENDWENNEGFVPVSPERFVKLYEKWEIKKLRPWLRSPEVTNYPDKFKWAG